MIIIIVILNLLLAFGIFLVKSNFKPILHYFRMRKWKKVNGEITRIFVNETWYDVRDEIPATKALSVEYKYVADDKEYTSCNIYPDKPFTSISSKKTKENIYKRNIKTVINSIRKKPAVIVYVNPSKAEEASLINYSQSVTYMVWGITLIIWSVTFLYFTTNFARINIQDKVIIIEKNHTK